MKIFSNNISLRRKLVAIIMICCICALVLNNLFIFIVDTLEYKKDKINRLFILAEVISNNSTAALYFLDRRAANETLQLVVADDSINYAVILNERCEIFAEFKSPSNLVNQKPVKKITCNKNKYYLYTPSILCLSIPIISKNNTIGTLYIESNLNELRNKFFQQIQIFASLLLVTLFIVFLLSIKLQTYFIKPIKNLLSAIRHITQHRDYSIQVKSNTNDELALLADEFNTMIDKISQHEILLSNQNLFLEQTVKQRTNELQINLQQLTLAKESAEKADKAKSDFLAHMSHDLRTPLNGLLGYVQILQGKKDFPSKYINEINYIGQSGEYLLSLINDLLDLTKIESNQLDLTLNIIDINTFLNPLVDIFSNLAKKKNITFIYQKDNNLPLALYADENRLKRILSNLLDNAFKFTIKGYIKFTVDYKHNELIFSITDTGCGIGEKQLQTIYEPFIQFVKQNSNEGLGLGLYITQYLVKLMDGTLLITSKKTKGTCCHLTIPSRAAQFVSSAFDKYKDIVGYQGYPITILIVDDIQDNLDVLEQMLTPLGFNVVSVNSGTACLNILPTLQAKIILLDMVMPELDGIETCRQVQQLGLENTPKIIMITANAFAEDRDQCLAAGCDNFLAKPILLNQLLALFDDHLKIHWIYQESRKHSVLQKDFGSNPLQILVADDSEICRLFLDYYLKEMKLNATFAEDGEQALNLIKNTVFDCILLDLNMPYKTGLEIVNYIKNNETPNNTSYLVAITALTNAATNKLTLHSGFDSILYKPIDLDEFAKVINTLYKDRAIHV